jgi:hypothetical protein
VSRSRLWPNCGWPPSSAAAGSIGAITDYSGRTQIWAIQPVSAAAYRRYGWPTKGLAGLKVAPFQLLAAVSAADRGRR